MDDYRILDLLICKPLNAVFSSESDTNFIISLRYWNRKTIIIYQKSKAIQMNVL